MSFRRFGRLTDDRVVLGTLLVLAAVLRLPNLASRGQFNADQGHDALTLLRFTRDGVVPLLGPPTSIGDFHHGAFYYYLLAPVAAISGANPVALEVAIALMGVAAVGVTWWLARAMAGAAAGPGTGALAGAIAGLLLAVSPAGIDESIFIWNPNPIPLFAALSLAAAWHAHRTGRVRWWVLAIACAGAVFQLHVLGVVFIPPVLGLLVADVRAARRRGDGTLAGRLVRGGIGGIAVIALLFVPLLVHELQHDWSETRNAVAYFTADGSSAGDLGLPARLLFTLLRIVGWPLVGLVTDVPLAAVLCLAVVLTLGLWGATSRGTHSEARFALRWLLLTVAWATIALAILAPSLQTVVAGLPNDHYHAYLDPIVVTITGIGGALLATGAGQRAATAPIRRGAVAVIVVVLLAMGVSRWPAWTDPNGGWTAAEAAGAKVVEMTGSQAVVVEGLPTFESPDAVTFPIVKAGGNVRADGTDTKYVILVCDRLFEQAVGYSCDEPAFDPNGSATPDPLLIQVFDVSPRLSIWVYRT